MMAGGGDISGCACLGKPSNSKVFAFIVGNFFFLLTVDYFSPNWIDSVSPKLQSRIVKLT